MSASAASRRPRCLDRVLDRVERMGNRLPDPLVLFAGLFLLTAVLTTVLGALGAQVQVPGEDEPVQVRSFFSGAGLTWFTTTMGENYIGFPPLVNVLPIVIAVGIAEGSGMLSAGIRGLFGSAPRWLLPYVIAFVGVNGNLMSDTSFVVIPPLAALVFAAAGRHPVAGLIGGFAAVGASFSTAMLPSPIDANFAGITSGVMGALPESLGATPVTVVSNYWINLASSLVLVLACGALIDRVLEPRLARAGIPRTTATEEEGAQDDVSSAVGVEEKRALVWAGATLVGLVALIVAIAVAPFSPWQSESGGLLPDSPFMGSIVFLIVMVFSVTGIVYGARVGTIRTGGDVARCMGQGLQSMTSFLVVAFALAQFLALFEWSGVGTYLAVHGAAWLQSAQLGGLPVVLAFVVLCAAANLFITSGTSMWGLMAVVFVPMLGLTGIEPAFVQAAFRIGDSSTQIITPLSPYLIVLLGMVRRYEPGAGLGTLVARLLPFTLVFFTVWVAILLVFYGLDLPIGPANDIHLG
ncbi:AbgT family transporter [Brachybacterium sp.]|uniref:AbgT family transporter n=1 Tax=Brachybacterium sp. TaxID=1891286 RepID=UPI002649961F|nr:AbgT family transporter [Brachybacterium sp.]